MILKLYDNNIVLQITNSFYGNVVFEKITYVDLMFLTFVEMCKSTNNINSLIVLT